MSDRSDRAKLESILATIQDIHKIIDRHETIENALSDIEGQYALMMCLQQIGELVNRIEAETYRSHLPVKEIVAFRNLIAHNYDGVNFILVRSILTESIPELKQIIKQLLK